MVSLEKIQDDIKLIKDELGHTRAGIQRMMDWLDELEEDILNIEI